MKYHPSIPILKAIAEHADPSKRSPLIPPRKPAEAFAWPTMETLELWRERMFGENGLYRDRSVFGGADPPDDGEQDEDDDALIVKKF